MKDSGAFQIIGFICLSAIVAIIGLYVIKAEFSKFKFVDKNTICNKYNMTYTYARMDMCIDKEGRLYSMSVLEGISK